MCDCTHLPTKQAWLAFLEMISPARMLPKLLINRTPPLQAAPKSSLAENQSRLPDDKLKEIELFLQQFEQKCLQLRALTKLEISTGCHF